MEEAKNAQEEPAYIAPRPQIVDQMLGDDDSVPQQIEQPVAVANSNEPYKGKLEGLSYTP